MWQGDRANPSIGTQSLRERIQAVLAQMSEEANPIFPRLRSVFFSASLLEMLIERYHRSLCAYVFSLLGEYDAAQDIAQDTWVALYRYIEEQPSSWLEDANIPALLWTVAKHKAINYMKGQRRISSLDSENTTFVFEPHVPPFDYPENTALRGDVCLALYQAVNSLGKSQQEVITLRFFYDYSLEAIASTLKMPLGTVKSHLRRGQLQLRRLLAARGINRNDIGLWDKTQERFPKAILRE